MPFERVTIIGLGLLGGSIGLAARKHRPDIRTSGYDSDPNTRDQARDLGLVDEVCDNPATAVEHADLVVLCVPVGAMGYAADAIRAHLPDTAIVSDVGSSKQGVLDVLRAALPDHSVIPAHPVAGTERSGPAAGFAELFEHRWCILTPPEDAPDDATQALAAFWESLGSRVEIMDANHHDLVLAVTSHIPHLIAYTIVGTA
ncbi:MAG: prephenate dehydrogenase/arogenate dehydrogenase family protein, partial [Pontixanthobacter sp.]